MIPSPTFLSAPSSSFPSPLSRTQSISAPPVGATALISPCEADIAPIYPAPAPSDKQSLRQADELHKETEKDVERLQERGKQTEQAPQEANVAREEKYEQLPANSDSPIEATEIKTQLANSPANITSFAPEVITKEKAIVIHIVDKSTQARLKTLLVPRSDDAFVSLLEERIEHCDVRVCLFLAKLLMSRYSV